MIIRGSAGHLRIAAAVILLISGLTGALLGILIATVFISLL